MTDPKPLTVLDLAKPDADWRTVNPHDGTELDGRYFRAYKAKSGRIQLMPSQELLEELEDDDCGFCLACGSYGTPAEPDAERYTCEYCGEAKVYGAAELAVRGLCF